MLGSRAVGASDTPRGCSTRRSAGDDGDGGVSAKLWIGVTRLSRGASGDNGDEVPVYALGGRRGISFADRILRTAGSGVSSSTDMVSV